MRLSRRVGTADNIALPPRPRKRRGAWPAEITSRPDLSSSGRPDTSAARVDLEKLTESLLSDTHLVGKSKAAFFRRLGFTRERPEELLRALLRIARSEPIVDRMVTPFGTKYVLDGEIDGPDHAAVIRTVWFLERNAAAPRLIAAYPERITVAATRRRA